jgi:hypothetical protein
VFFLYEKKMLRGVADADADGFDHTVEESHADCKKGSEVKYHLTHKMAHTLHNYPVMLHLRTICHSG